MTKGPGALHTGPAGSRARIVGRAYENSQRHIKTGNPAPCRPRRGIGAAVRKDAAFCLARNNIFLHLYKLNVKT
jgi:hypothetical protein